MVLVCKGEGVTGEWRKLHNEKRNDLYTPPNINREIKERRRLAGYVACMGEWRRAYRIFIERLEGRRTLGRPRRHWKIILKRGLKEVGGDYGLY
jgi:hypothetical protein